MILDRGPLLVAHSVAGTLLVIVLLFQLHEREQRLVQLHRDTDRDLAETARMNGEIAELENLRDGLAKKDPYVVELITRQKLGYSRPGEFAVPPAVDKPAREDIR